MKECRKEVQKAKGKIGRIKKYKYKRKQLLKWYQTFTVIIQTFTKGENKKIFE